MITVDHLWVYLAESAAEEDGRRKNERDQERVGGWTSRTVWGPQVLEWRCVGSCCLSGPWLQRQGQFLLPQMTITSRKPSNIYIEIFNSTVDSILHKSSHWHL